MQCLGPLKEFNVANYLFHQTIASLVRIMVRRIFMVVIKHNSSRGLILYLQVARCIKEAAGEEFESACRDWVRINGKLDVGGIAVMDGYLLKSYFVVNGVGMIIFLILTLTFLISCSLIPRTSLTFCTLQISMVPNNLNFP